MAVFAMGDLHLSLGTNKEMDAFPGWENYVARIQENWEQLVSPQDTVVLCGDTSWGMDLKQSLPDFAFIHRLPGRKILLKGNHDYWWTSLKKMTAFFEENGFGSLEILHNNFIEAEGMALCGSRGWLFETGQPHDDKLINRETQRLDASLSAAKGFAGEKIAFLHYPPVYSQQITKSIMDVLQKHCIQRCYYGHIHGVGHRYAVQGPYQGIRFSMISADYLRFRPLLIESH